jgi:AAA domain
MSDLDPGVAAALKRQRLALGVEPGAVSENGREADDDVLERMRAKVYTPSEVCALPPLEPLVEGLLFVPGESVLYSPPKLAKTFMALDLTFSVATGQPFMGRDVRQGPVVFVAAEGVGGLGVRIQAWHDYHARLVAHSDQVTFLTRAVNLTDPASVDALCSFVAEREAILTVIDTLHRCATGADENSARDMGRIIESIDAVRDATGGHVGTLHHAGKDLSRGMRGSSSLLGAVDTVIELSGDGDAIRCEVTDQKDAEPARPWWCHLEEVGASAVVVQASNIEMLTGTQRKTLKALSDLPPEDRTSTKWEVMAKSAGIGRSWFYATKKELLETGQVTGGGGRGGLYTIPEPGQEGQ